jgi:hypothetical protein
MKQLPRNTILTGDAAAALQTLPSAIGRTLAGRGSAARVHRVRHRASP